MKELNVKAIDIGREGTQVFENGRKLDASVRTLGEMHEVLLSSRFITEDNGRSPLYYMYRGVGSSDPAFGKHRIRYDITILESMDLGGEFNKTLGHYHPLAEDGLAYPELYEVVEGEALYILQRRLPNQEYDVVLTRAKAGDKVLMPPNYGHITVNTGKELLVMANLVNADFKSDYKPIEEKHGAAVYAMSDNSLLRNESYGNVKLPGIGDAERIGYLGKESIYDQFMANPALFEFLNRPSLLAGMG